jgi:CHAD domain-containing protein
VFEIPKNINQKRIIDTVSQHFTIEREDNLTENYIYFDTYDWKLLNKNLLLIKKDKEYVLHEIKNNKEEKLGITKIPKSVSDFQGDPKYNYLKKIIENRALLRFVKTRNNTKYYLVKNSDDKIVVRFAIENVKVIDSKREILVGNFIDISPLRGYLQEKKIFEALLLELKLIQINIPLINKISEKASLKIGEYTSKIDFKFDKNEPINDAVVKLYLYLMEIMKKNEDGIRKNVDIEFLHDFRTSLRKTRAGLSQIKGVFPEEVVAEYKERFADIQRKTNNARDLDVYLSEKCDYYEITPAEVHEGLDEFFNLLELERKKEQTNLKRLLSSKFYKSTLSDWNSYLNNYKPPDENLVNVLVAAKIYINKKLKSVIKKGKKITSKSAEAQLHDLRIECKKLRYLLEFFKSVFPKKEIEFIINQLKSLQDYLGEFNDLSVHKEKLKIFLEEYSEDSKEPIMFATAVGALISIKHTRQMEIRKQFKSKFHNFIKAENLNKFEALLK